MYNPFIQLYIEGAERVIIERSRRARCMSITVKHGYVRVAVPDGVSPERGRAFALSRSEWIRRHLTRIQQRQNACMELLKSLPPIVDINAAVEKIVSRCAEISKETGLSYRRLTVRNQKSRWGSCSSTDAISLNIKLARLPQRLLDYVIIHELVHTKIKGHTRAFWNELDRYIEDVPLLKKELGQYIPELL